METTTVRLQQVSVTDGQGASEGDFELSIDVSDGTRHVLTWPDNGPWEKVRKNGTVKVINKVLGTYKVNSGRLRKSFDVTVREIDGGINGGDDEGSGKFTFDLTPNMRPETKHREIQLWRPNKKKPDGAVKVFLTAEHI